MRGLAPVPRWTRSPVPGVRKHVVKVSSGLMAELRGLAKELGVPHSAVLLTAHAKVLAALSGEPEVCTGYATGSAPPLPFRTMLRPGSWRDALMETARAESRWRFCAESPDGDSGSAPGGPSFETVFQIGRGAGELPGDVVLRVGVEGRNGCVWEVRFRGDVLDDECAARIAGYHVAALASIAADPDADHGRANLLSARERDFQLDGLAGRQTTLPDRPAHELFEEQVRERPDDVAVVHGDRLATYRDLNARANRLARALLASGLAPEGVVGVVTERDLDWTIAVLAILKAGGAYLPLEPQFPAERIATTLSRAGCRLVLTEAGSRSNLDRATRSLPGVETLLIDAACEGPHRAGDLGLDIAPDRLAYIYFTSGSTGEPKGAMCEHAGMLNHLLAKIGDLGIGAGTVVAQTAPQCFDISLWQLISALLVGGRTLIVEQAAVLDAERFLDEVAERRVNVLQVVPSYLEVLVSSLARHPRTLSDLRFVSVTGEAFPRELAQRWFAVQPRIRLLNAYGLTETSDDTNHEILDREPDGARVPLGRPIPNVRVYVVDEHLSPVPLGAPGEIVFSGVCVGRGYVQDPERTRRAFLPDPHQPGRRLYRSGDFGRWLPDGKLEFLGRRDSQVKVAGFRIEIGEIENRLLRLPGVHAGAVVVLGGDERSKRLVAFCAGRQHLDAGALRDGLRASLPEYMVPAAIHWRSALPLTAHGKVDRKALAALAEDLESAAPREPSVPRRSDHRGARTSHDESSQDDPGAPAEHRLTARWAEVLGIPADRIDRHAHFFDLGGTSLSALKLAIALDRALTFREIQRHPVLAAQAELIERRLGRGVRTAPERDTRGPMSAAGGSAAEGGG